MHNSSGRHKSKISFWDKHLFMNLAVRAEFYRNMEYEFAGGGNVNRGLEQFIDELEGIFGSRRKKNFRIVKERLVNGDTLSVATAGFFPAEDQLFLKSLEDKQDKASGFHLLASRAERAKAGRMDTILAFTPSLFILTVAVFVFHFAGGTLDDAINRSRTVIELEGFSALAASFSRYSYPVVAAFATIPLWVMLLIGWSFSNWTGSTRRFFDNFGPWKTYREATGSALLLNFSEMFNSGIGIKEAVISMGEDASPWLKRILNTAYEGVVAGDLLGTALLSTGTALPSKSILTKLKLIEQADGFAEKLRALVTSYGDQNAQQTRAKISFYAFISMIVGLLGIAMSALLMFGISKIVRADIAGNLY
ncbi:MAG: type II secretion system F family protein [Kordiimonadaceae bacterium]|nr:type II secretion system F family protein [Kordiimonadaceae bacterium]